MKTFTSSSLLLLLSLGIAFSEPVQFPSTSSGSLEKDASSPSTSSVGDHEESEQVQAFVIADPSQSASSSASTRGGDSEDGPDPETVNPLAASLLLNLALNNMAATMAYPPGGQPFRPSKGSDCGCGCKCGHGSRGVLCSYCQERGWGRGSPCPCAKERSLELRSSDMVSAGSYFYPIYYDPSSGVVLPGQERASQFQNPWTPIAAATYARPTYAYRPVPRYYYSPQYYYAAPPVTQQPSMAASYPVPAYAYPPVSYAASTPVYAIAAAPRPAPVVISRRSSFLPYYGAFSSPYAMMPKYAAGYF